MSRSLGRLKKADACWGKAGGLAAVFPVLFTISCQGGGPVASETGEHRAELSGSAFSSPMASPPEIIVFSDKLGEGFRDFGFGIRSQTDDSDAHSGDVSMSAFERLFSCTTCSFNELSIAVTCLSNLKIASSLEIDPLSSLYPRYWLPHIQANNKHKIESFCVAAVYYWQYGNGGAYKFF